MSIIDDSILNSIKYRDSFRAQYYFLDFRNVVRQLISHVQQLGCIDVAGILLELLQHLADELDDMILPVVIFEIHAHKQEDDNLTAHERYQKFFIDTLTKSWTNEAREIVRKYCFVFVSITTFCHSTVENIKECLTRLVLDINLIRETLSPNANSSNLLRIHLSGSDRHRNGQTVVFLTFQGGHKIVYKNCDASLDQALHKFIKLLCLGPPYDIKTRKFIKRNHYAWYEYVEHKFCNDLSEIRNYYKRAGSMLAVLDTLNYCDGHCENFIAHGEFLYLIDSETLFQNFVTEELQVKIGSLYEERSILFTGLIDKPDQIEKCDRSKSCSAFQAAGFTQQIFQPIISNDHTDKIKIRFNRSDNDTSIDEFSTPPTYTILQNAPCLDNHAYTVESFLNEFIDGYTHTYQLIQKHSALLLDTSNEFWYEVKMISSAREIIRTTLFYAMLIRRLQQPNFSGNREMARQYLLEYLRLHSFNLSLTLIEYEVEELLKLDIPYFAHHPNSKDLFAGDDARYANYFMYSAVEQIRSNIEHASGMYCDRQVAILRNVVKAMTPMTPHCPCYKCSER